MYKLNQILKKATHVARLLKIVVKTEGYLQKFFVWVWPDLEICSLFQTRKLILYILFQALSQKKLIPHFRPLNLLHGSDIIDCC